MTRMIRNIDPGSFGVTRLGRASPGLLESVGVGAVCGALAYLIYSRMRATPVPMPMRPKHRAGEMASFGGAEEDLSYYASSKASAARVLIGDDLEFDVNRFIDDRVDDFYRVQNAWSDCELTALSSRLDPRLFREMTRECQELRRRGVINHLENVVVREAELVDAWKESEAEYATVRFNAYAIDYTFNPRTQKILAGDPSYPIKFEEYWTFTRSTRGRRGEHPWMLTSISQGEDERIYAVAA